MQKLFLCHYRGDAAEVHLLAQELQLRGIAPWVDQRSGFAVGDENAAEAERAIREDCFGLLFYATRAAFGRPFIRKVEMSAALARKDADSSFVLFAVPRRISFGDVASLSVKAFGADLSIYASTAICGYDRRVKTTPPLQTQFAKIATEVLRKRLIALKREGVDGVLPIQYSTRERLADEAGDVLRIDATPLRAASGLSRESWERLHAALLDTKAVISEMYGRPRLRVHGSKHLTAATLLGYVFPPATCELDLRTKFDYWATDSPPCVATLLTATEHGGSIGSDRLYVEISVGAQPVRAAVNRYVRETRVSPQRYLRMVAGPEIVARGRIDNADACAIAAQFREAVLHVIGTHDVGEIHLFAAVPQALAVMLGRTLGALPPVQLYEYNGVAYTPSYRLAQEA